MKECMYPDTTRCNFQSCAWHFYFCARVPLLQFISFASNRLLRLTHNQPTLGVLLGLSRTINPNIWECKTDCAVIIHVKW